MAPGNKSRVLAIVAFVLLACTLCWTAFSFREKASDAERSDITSMNRRKLDESDTPVLHKDEAKKKKRADSKDADIQLAKINSVTGSIIRALEDDELTRAVLVEEKEKQDAYTYLFEIKRRQDMDGFVSQLCKESAEREGVNLSALRRVVLDSVQGFSMPEGCVQRVFIKVSKDPDKGTLYSMMPISQSDHDGHVHVSGKATSATGNVPPGSKGWRYEKLLELRPEG